MGEIFTKERTKIVMIILTHSCNLNCVYCYEHNKTSQSKTINFEIVKSIIEEEIKKKLPNIQISSNSFYGW